MIDAGAARAVMDNHELNAIAWHTPDPTAPGEYLRPRDSPTWGSKNRAQHAAFLAEVESRPLLHAEIIDWFWTCRCGSISRRFEWCTPAGMGRSSHGSRRTWLAASTSRGS